MLVHRLNAMFMLSRIFKHKRHPKNLRKRWIKWWMNTMWKMANSLLGLWLFVKSQLKVQLKIPLSSWTSCRQHGIAMLCHPSCLHDCILNYNYQFIHHWHMEWEFATSCETSWEITFATNSNMHTYPYYIM